MQDFVMMPRQFKDDLHSRKLNWRQYQVLSWLYINTNPYDGKWFVSYESLVEDFKEDKITNDSMRKIISSLRKHNYIWFKDHRGKGGKFTIYPLNFQLSNKHIQSKKDFEITTKDDSRGQTEVQQAPQPEDNSDVQIHNLIDQDSQEKSASDRDKSNSEITTSYTNTKTDIYKSTFINVEEFQPKNSDDARCQEIAEELDIKHINYLLKMKNKYGIMFLERALGIFKELERGGKKIEDPAAYFGGILRNSSRDSS